MRNFIGWIGLVFLAVGFKLVLVSPEFTEIAGDVLVEQGKKHGLADLLK